MPDESKKTEDVNDDTKTDSTKDEQTPPNDTETKSSESKGSEEKKSEAPSGVSEVPKEYEKFNLPEGMTFSDEVLSNFSKKAKSLKLDQAQAQSMIDLGVSAVKSYSAKQEENWTETVNKWQEELKKDKEYGGDKLETTMKNAKTALVKFASKEFVEYLDKYGLSAHPEMIRVFAKIHEVIKEDTTIDGDTKGDTKKKKNIADNLFGNKGAK